VKVALEKPDAIPSATAARAFCKQGRIVLQFMKADTPLMEGWMTMVEAMQIAGRLADCAKQIAGEQDEQFRRATRHSGNQSGTTPLKAPK
jgi:hypothetical protein